jgi:hypothetical protein
MLFLTRSTLYRLIERELPEGVYADSGTPSAYFTTASVMAKAIVLETIYTNLSRIYDNYWPQFTDERIDDWEIKVFGEVSNAGLTLFQRQTKVLNKIRKKPTLALWEILTLVASYVPEGKFVQVVEWGCPGHDGGGQWILGTSRFDVDTALGWEGQRNMQPTIAAINGDFCAGVVADGWRFNASHLGTQTKLSGMNSWQTISAAQKRAYTYEVRIFDYTLSDADTAKLERDLQQFEPARSAHIIRQNLQLADFGLLFTVMNVDQFSGVNCITVDPSQTTGYSGRVTVNGI